MTTKELLRRMIDAMTDEEADRALRALGATKPEMPTSQQLPDFVGSFASGDGTLSQRTRDLLADGFGR
ncbi:MAG: hypothetical protein BGO26_20090 [Actinobacteria bacterium 69-20]|jgi:hypothetical protein|nr:hypothetical protein [Actinomycetota bacterium]OJV24817.1 MAG: hypothetical protein BGO26_20090 [Actinobacteria bacterium 69-20]